MEVCPCLLFHLEWIPMFTFTLGLLYTGTATSKRSQPDNVKINREANNENADPNKAIC